MGAKQSAGGGNPRVRTYSNAGQSSVTSNGAGGGGLAAIGGGPSSSSNGAGSLNARARTRSLGSVTQNGPHGQPLVIPSANGGPGGSPDSDTSTPEEGGPFARGLIQASSLPVHLLSFHGKSPSYLHPIFYFTERGYVR